MRHPISPFLVILVVLASGCASTKYPAQTAASSNPPPAIRNSAPQKPVVWIRGEVKQGSHAIAWREGMSAWNAIDESGGVTYSAANMVLVYRNEKAVDRQSLYLSRLIKLLPDDIVLVPTE